MYKVKAITRLQKFLNAIAGNGEAPEPITDSEKLLANIAEGGGGGGNDLIVTLDTNTNTIDKTFDEIATAFHARRNIYLYQSYPNSEAVVKYTLSAYYEAEHSRYAMFYTVIVEEVGSIVILTIEYDDETQQITITPHVMPIGG